MQDEPGRNCIDRDVERRNVLGELRRNTKNTGFGRRIGETVARSANRSEPTVRDGRGHVDNPAVALIPHDRHDGAAAHEGAAQVEIYDQLPIIILNLVDLMQIPWTGTACNVGQGVDPTMGRHRCADRGLDIGTAQHIHWLRCSFATGISNHTGSSGKTCFILISQEQGEAIVR